MEDFIAESQIHAYSMIIRSIYFLFQYPSSRVFLSLLFVISSSFISAQNPYQTLSTKNKKAEKVFFNAIDGYNNQDYAKAIAEVEKAIQIDPEFVEAFILKGDILSDTRQIPEAINAYRSAIHIKPDFSPNLYYIIANLEYSNGFYIAAKSDFEKYISFDYIPKLKKDKAINGIRTCDFAIYLVQNPVPFDPINLGDSINSPEDEYINYITADDQVLYFTRNMVKSRLVQQNKITHEEDFFISRRIVDTLWGKAKNLGPPINTGWNEGALTISPDGQYLFFAGCGRPDGYGSCDLYWSKRIGNYWSEPTNLGPIVNTEQWESQPSFSSDGATLYFVSNRKGGKGSSDIWKTMLNPDGTWNSPVNLGDSINTPFEEQTPFIHPDNQTLYFASRGFPGMGGADIYYCHKDSVDRWGKGINMGYPINTFADENSLVVNAKGNLAYISSDKLGGKGKQDIYRFQVYEQARPIPVTYFKGIVFNKETNQKLKADFELTDLRTGRTVVRSSSDSLTGSFFLILPVQNDYALNISKPGYLFFSEHFSLSNIHSFSKPFVKNIPLQEIKMGESVILKNIFFETDKYDLKPESQVELKRLIDLLIKNPELRIEISGHTDNIGTQEHNANLSLKRANAVCEYLIQHGIAENRMSFAGYGFSKPIDTNETENGRANNRRTEFKIIGN